MRTKKTKCCLQNYAKIKNSLYGSFQTTAVMRPSLDQQMHQSFTTSTNAAYNLYFYCQKALRLLKLRLYCETQIAVLFKEQ